jgi:hypothetical protein
MTIREAVNRHRAIVSIAAGAGISFLFGYIIYLLMPHHSVPPSKLFFSDDDGATYYKDDITNIPPYDHHGKVAVRAFVFHSSSGNFVGYLQKYTDEMKARLGRGEIPMGPDSGARFKKPGTGNPWVDSSSREFQDLMNVKPPGDPAGPLEMVDP